MLGEHMGPLIAARHQKVGAGSVLNAGGGGAGLLADQGAMVEKGEKERRQKVGDDRWEPHMSERGDVIG